MAHAQSGSSPLSASYVAGSGDIYARVVNGLSGCFDISTVSLTVNTLPVANNASLVRCSDSIAGDTATFILTILDASIDPTQSYPVSYHRSLAEAIAGTAPLPDTFRSNSVDLFARVVNGACVNTSEVELTSNTVPASIAVNDTACSDIPGGLEATFNLAGLDVLVDTTGSFSVSYHDLLLNAQQGLNPLSSSYLTASTTIYARVENGTTGCFTTAPVNLTVNTTPAANATPLAICATGPGANQASFDLTSLNLNVDPSGVYNVTYHESQVNADLGAAALVSPYVSVSRTIFARVENGNTGCYATAPIVLTVIDIPVSQNYTDTLCSSSPGGTVADFTLTNYDFFVDPSQSYNVTYHATQANADADMMPLASPYTTASDTLFVRVENGTTGCYSTSELYLVVHITPVALPTSIALCEDPPGSGLADFDLVSLNPQVDPTNSYVVTYHLSLLDADADQFALNSPYNTGNDTLFARVENGATGCYSTSEVYLRVFDATPIPVLQDTAEVCGEDSPITLPLENQLFLDTLILSGLLPNDPIWATQWIDIDGAFGTPNGTLASSLLSFNSSQLGFQYRFAYVVTGIAGGSCGDQADTVVIDVVDCFYSIGNQVFFDVNNNSQRELSEQGVDGVTMALYAADALGNPTGSLLALDTTQNGGYYVFPTLPEGDYVVAVASSNFQAGGVLEGYLSSGTSFNTAAMLTESPAANPGNEADDDDNGEKRNSGLLAGFVASDVISLGGIEPTADDDNTGGAIDFTPDDQADYTVDFGFYRMEIGEFVFEDLDNNGLFQPANGDTGIANITVRLYDNLGNEIPVGPDGIFGTADDQPGGVLTAADGSYLFSGLPEGVYEVIIDIPATYASSSGQNGSQTGPYEPAPGASLNLPRTDDGTQTAMTASSGLDTLDAGSFGNASFNWVNPFTGTTSDTTVSFGLYRRHSLGDVVWYDLNNNGQIDAGEQPVDGVPMSLYKDDGSGGYALIDRDTTQSGGYYLFTFLSEGDYVVAVDAGNFAADAVLDGYYSSGTSVAPTGISSEIPADDADANPANDDDNGQLATSGPWAGGVASLPVTLGDGEPLGEPSHVSGRSDYAADAQANYTLDFGFYTQTLAGTVWNDANNSGILDAVELGIGSVHVELYSGDGTTLLAVDTTDSLGNYSFDGLREGDYIVRILPPDASWLSSSGQNGAATGPYEPGADPENVNVDSDDNGTTGSGVNSGFIVSLPLTMTPGNEVQNDASTGRTSNDFLDFGLFQPVAVGNYVWLDDDGLRTALSTSANGQADAGETAIDGVAVSIYYLDENGDGLPDDPQNPVDRDTTANGGFYLFDFLAANSYVIAIDSGNFQAGGPLDGLVSTDPSEATANGGLDQNDNGLQNGDYVANGVLSSRINLAVGMAPTGELPALAGATSVPDSSAYLNVDFGFVAPAQYGNLVWDDLDGDGQQSAAEPGIAGLQVYLYTYDPVSQISTLIDSQLTGSDGKYLFDNLLPNRYYLARFDNIPPNYTYTTRDVLSNTGNSDSLDSDAHPASGLTVPTLLSPNERDTSWDAGLYFQSAVIGDFVWIDENRNGLQDPGEQGLPGVTVYLFQNGAYIDTMVTDGSGRYRFRDLVPGNYRVVFDLNSLPANYVATTPNVGVTDASDSDADVSSGFTDPISLSPNEVDLSWDLGVYIPLGSIGDFVWFDYVENGTQDLNEPGVAGVTVFLLDSSGAVLDSTVTDSTGAYLFDNLLPGNYGIQFDLTTIPAGHAVVAADAGSNDGKDSDPDPLRGLVQNIALAAGQNDRSIDMGIMRLPAALGGLVWDDLNRDGIQDSSEQPVQNIIVYLVDSSNFVLRIDTTDASGAYFFGGLDQGDYKVFCDQLPATYVVSPQNQGTNDSIDSDGDVATRVTQLISLQLGDTSLYWDLGIHRPAASLGDYVWDDSDGDGIQDAGESPIGGAWVYLLDSTGTRIDSQQTASDGSYGFTGLLPGDYAILVIPPNGYDFTQPNAGSDDAVDSDIDPVTGTSQTISLAAGQHDPDLDAGLFQPASIGDFVWLDVNADGLQQGEPGVADVMVNLLDDQGNIIATDTTDSSGAYLFDGLAPGDYVVDFQLPNGFVFSPNNQGTDIQMDSDANPATGQSGNINLLSGDHIRHVDAGIYQHVALGDYVWIDQDADGVQDTNEPGLAGVVMLLLDDQGAVVDTDTTDANGAYFFDNLDPGTWQVAVQAPPGYISSPTDATTDNQDSDFDPVTLTVPAVTLPSGAVDSTIDAGFIPVASVGDYVWDDVNRNGVQDTSERGIPAVIVYLQDTLGNVLATDTTDVNGFYLFDNLMAGSYTVRFETPSGYTPTSSGGSDPATNSDPVSQGTTSPFALSVGEHNRDIDAGYYQDFDLALIKILAPGQARQVLPGDTVAYQVIVINQGPAIAQQIKVEDYLPAGTSLLSSHWTDNGNGSASYTFAGPLLVGESDTIDIAIALGPFLGAGSLQNFAEISRAEDLNGISRSDSDGSFDSDPSNDGTPVDNAITDPADEDNHDVEEITVSTPPCEASCDLDDFTNNQYSFLFTAGAFPGTDPTYRFVNGSGNIKRFDNGSAHITGVLQNRTDPNLRWDVDVWLILEKDWGSWSANGGSYKIGSSVPSMLFQTWSFYEVDSLRSRLTGQGGLAGDTLFLSHNPVNREYGFQYGQGANSFDADFGLSGWFNYTSHSGNFNGSGDFIADVNNCNTNCFSGPSGLAIAVILEGAYQNHNGQMRTALNQQQVLALNQPFNKAPWNYSGTEQVTVMPHDSIVDWVLVEVRDTANRRTIRERYAAFLLHNGTVVGIDGHALLPVPQDSAFYLAVHHRNHLSMMTDQPVQILGSTYFADLTDGLTVYTSPTEAKTPYIIIDGKAMMMQGDETGDNQVNSLDLGGVMNGYFTIGNNNSDINLDGVTNSIDVTRAYGNYFRRSHVPK